jgi:formylmethanofuran dehydrogenase subunit E
MDTLKIDPKTADLEAMIARGIHLHGHEGPFLIAGIRMGLLALDLLQSTGYFGLTAQSHTGSTTPLSCLTDGIQIGSGCTTGKGNLTVISEARPRARFTSEDGATVMIEVSDAALVAFRDGELAAESQHARTMPVEELFAWEKG